MSRLFPCLLLMLASAAVLADQATVAVVAGFRPAMEPIVQQFESQTGHHIAISYGAAGKLYAQIENGAPFDLLLSADGQAPARLEADGLGIKGSRTVYARSALVLYSPDPKRVDSQGAVLRQGNFHHLALPNPKVAVHGAAAMAVLTKLGLAQQLAPKLVEGGNILQTYQQIETGNAELGFVSLALLTRPGQPIKGSYWIVPATLQPPLAQEAILLTHGAANPAAQALLAYLHGEQARQIIRDHGFQI